MTNNRDLVVAAGSKELSALAYLEASRQINNGADRLEYFMPIVEEVISQLIGVTFSLEDLRKRIQSQFSINLPIAVVDSLLSRCSRKGYITKNYGRFSRTNEPIPLSDLKDRRQELEEDTAELIKAAKEVALCDASFQGNWSDDELRAGLFDFLDSAYGDTMPSHAFAENSSADLWAMLFSTIFQNNEKFLHTLEALGRGVIIRDAAFFPSLMTSSQVFRSTIVYLDSAIVCWLLGISSYEQERYAKEAINILKESGVICRVLSITVDEIAGILYAIEKDWNTRIFDPSPNSYSRFMRQRGYTKEKIFELRNVLSKEIEQLNLRVVDPRQRIKNCVSDETRLVERLRDECDCGSIWSSRVQHDVTCIAEVLTVRNGCEPRQLNDVKAVFVAVSQRTISNVRKWWTEDEGHSEMVIPPILRFESLINYVWLANPIVAFDGIGKEAAMVTCASALLPSQRIWSAYITRLEAMVKDGSMSPEKATAVVQNNDLTLILRKEERLTTQQDSPDVNVFTKVTDEVIRAINKPALDAQSVVFEDEISALNAEHTYELENKQIEISQKQDTINQMQEKIDKLEKQHLDNIVRQSEKRARNISITIMIFLFVFLIGALWRLTNGFMNDGSFDNAAIISIVIGLIGVVCIPVGAYKAIYPKLQSIIQKKLQIKDNC